MYSVFLLASFSIAPDIPDSRAERVAARRAVAQGCTSAVAYVPVAVVAVAASGCTGAVAAAPAAGCAGASGRAFTPLRNAVARHDSRVASRVNARAAHTTYHPVTATYIAAPATLPAAPPLQPAPQTAPPPKAKPAAYYPTAVAVKRTPARTLARRVCPLGGCP